MRASAAMKSALLLCCLVLGGITAAGCSNSSPTTPSSTPNLTTSAAIAGNLADAHSSSASLAGVTGGSSATPLARSRFAGVTVRITGTSLSTVVDDSGNFVLSDVPAGNVHLQFSSDTLNGAADVNNVTTGQFVQLQIQVNGPSVVVLSDERSQKISICHTEGTGDYHLIDISDSAEAAHRAHGDGKIGEPVPGQPGKIFDSSCRPVGPAVDIEKSTNGEDADNAPGPQIPLGSTVTWRYVVKNTGSVDLTAVSVVDDRGVTPNCNGQTTLAVGASMTCTATGIATALGPYRNVGTVTAHWASGGNSGTVTDSDPSNYTGISPVDIKKFTNGEDADSAPGPSIVVGSAITWEYKVTNIGTVPLTGINVTDDRGVAVNCSGQTTLAPGATMTCIGSGVATLGQYSNVGTVTATWTAGQFSGTATDSDPSHYLGVASGQEGQKVSLCHRTGAGFFVLINVSVDAEPAHLAHGDGFPGGAVPGQSGKSFTSTCGIQ
jgi:hypothetical protein